MARHISNDEEIRLVREFLGSDPGYFVEVGANDPHEQSQSWHLEQRGWAGILVEPQPDMADKLRNARKARIFAVACSSPENAGSQMTLHMAGPMSSLERARMSHGAVASGAIAVPVRTLDEILAEAGAPAPLDFLSVDVEGHEIDVLRGFDFTRWRPRLLLLEDHVNDLSRHRFLKAAGYRLIRRTIFNGWYVPAGAGKIPGWRERLEIVRKYYLALPFRVLRNALRRLRGRGH